MALRPDGTFGLAVRRFDAHMISSPEGLEPDLVVLDIAAMTTRILPLPADAVALSDTEAAVATDRRLAHLVDDKLVTFATAAAPITALAYSPNGAALAAGGSDGSITIYRGAEIVTTLRGHTSPIRRLDWTSQGLLSIADDQALEWPTAD
jgi:WD40 repeat protein